MSDYPDYFGLQTFVNYGPYTEYLAIEVDIPKDKTVTVFNLLAAARIYSLYLQLSNVVAFDGVEVILTIDDDNLASQAVDELFARGWAVPGGFPLHISRYDHVAKDVNFVGASGITIAKSFKLEFENNTNFTIYTSGAIHYATVI